MELTAREQLIRGLLTARCLPISSVWPISSWRISEYREKLFASVSICPPRWPTTAMDCWDVEVYTDRYGWIEVIGIADRADFDLKSHSLHSKEDSGFSLEYPEPKKLTKLVVKPDMKKFGPLFKGDAPKILETLKDINASLLNQAFQKDGYFRLEIDDDVYELTPDLVNFQEVKETVRGDKIFPHVIEPSYGIDRILYSVLLHDFVQEGKRTILQLPADVAPIGVYVFPLVNKKELNEVSLKIQNDLRERNIITEYDISGTIGRRYARSDEIGVPFAITIDHQTLDDNTVTIRKEMTRSRYVYPFQIYT